MIYDFKQKKKINSLETNSCIQSLEILNNGLSLIAGYATGSIHQFELKSLKLLTVIKKAHLQKYDESVIGLMAIESKKMNAELGKQND